MERFDCLEFIVGKYRLRWSIVFESCQCDVFHAGFCSSLSPFFTLFLFCSSFSPFFSPDTFSFVKQILNLPFNTNNVIMVSFDIKSLFTNIPLDETIDIIVNKCFSNTYRFHGFTQQRFPNLLTMTVKNCHFLFHSKLYHQKDGVAMGSLLDLYSLTSSCHSMNVLGKIFSPKPLVIPALKRFFFCIPYTGQRGLQIRTQLHKLLPKAYPHISIRFVFRPTCRLSDFFPFKDRIPFAMRSHVVYKYKCQCCGALYVGQTRRHIHMRISEHMGVSSKTGKKRSVSQSSAVLTHHHLSKHTISDSDFTILTSGNSKFDLEMRESLLISKLKPILNNISFMPLYLF